MTCRSACAQQGQAGGSATAAAAAAVTVVVGTTTSSSDVAVTPSGETVDNVEEIRRSLSRHLRPKEILEPLSLKYGLKQLRLIPKRPNSNKRSASNTREYEEESIEDLFGKGGILASCSADPEPSTKEILLSSSSTKTTSTVATTKKTATALANPSAAAASSFRASLQGRTLGGGHEICERSVGTWQFRLNTVAGFAVRPLRTSKLPPTRAGWKCGRIG